MYKIIIMLGATYYTVKIQELSIDGNNSELCSEHSYRKASESISSPPLPYVLVRVEAFGLSTKIFGHTKHETLPRR
jgi:hypothetical protein